MATGDVKIVYAASLTGTITLTALAAGSAQQSIMFTNTATNALDGVMVIGLKTTSGTHGSDQCCYCHFYASPDGTKFSSPITSSTNALVAITTGMNLEGPAVINFGTSVTGLYSATKVIGSVAAIFGGQLPANFGVVIENKTNIALTNTAADHFVWFFPTYENVSPN